MENTENQRKEFPKSSLLIVAIILGAFVGLGLYQASSKGLLPLNNSLTVGGNSNTERNVTVIKEENAVIDAVAKASPSVVAIGATQQTFNPFDPFSTPSGQNNTIGTGFVVSDKGIIVTNKHVVSDIGLKYNVVTGDGKKFQITKIYRDPVLDLAIVQIDGTGLKALELGDSSKLKVGQTMIAIGNALGRFTNTVTTGVVSGLGRRVVAGDLYSGSVESLDNLIQTDAAINPGNSGGPLLNSAGQVIGMNVATTEGAQNIGFAIPINSIKKISDEFVNKGTVSRPFLGIQYRFISKDIALLRELPQGAYVQQIVSGSPAEKAGLADGDIVTKINDQPVDSESKISDVISFKQIGDKIVISVWRNNKEIQLTTILQELPSQ